MIPSRRPLTATERSLVRDNAPLAYRCVSRFLAKHERLTPYREDLEQEAILGLMIGVQRWNPEKGALSTIAWSWINFFVHEAGRNWLNVSTQKRSPRGGNFDYRTEVPSDDWWEQTTAFSPTTEREVTAKQTWRNAHRQIAQLIKPPKNSPRGGPSAGSSNPERDAEMFLRAEFGDEECTDIARQFGMSRTRVYQLLGRTRAAFNTWAHEVRLEQEAA